MYDTSAPTRCPQCRLTLQSGQDVCVLPEFGELHEHCTLPCPCGVRWPASVVTQPVLLITLCAGCARRAVDRLLDALGVPA